MRAIIIGAGVGGMASACRLAKLGISSTIYEKNNSVGGRLNSIREKGFRIDTGPTLLLMPWVVREFFSDVGRKIEDYLELEKLEPVYRINFDDGSTIAPSSEKQNMLKAISSISKSDADSYDRYLKDYKKYYEIALKEFILKNFDSPIEMLSLSGIFSLISGGALKDLYSKTGEYFKDPRVRISFSLQAIYIGAPPHSIPSVYGLIPYVEFTEGVWYPKGGLSAFSDALERLCGEFKVGLRKGAEVKRIIIENGQATGVELSDGTIDKADIVISDADLPYTYLRLIPEKQRQHMKDKKVENLDTSCSAFMIYLGIDGSYDIPHHNFILPLDFKKTFDEIFKSKVLPLKPGIYISNPSSHDPTLAPKGKSVIYILVPVPNLSGNVDWKKEKAALREKVLSEVEKIGLDGIKDKIVFERIYTPEDWKGLYSLEKGATFGLSPTLWQSAALRPPNKDPKIKNLYFVGASTHPGSGIPIVLLSSKLLEMRMKKDFGV